MNPRIVLFLALVVCRAEIIDRIAVVVGNSVITESEIVREIRLTAFLNGEPLDFSATSKRKTADRMVEQRLLQIENEAGLYPPPAPDALDQTLQQAQSRFLSPARYSQELRRTGITEEELKAHLLRQLITLRFLDLRFRPGIQISEEEIVAYFDQRFAPELKKSHPGEQFSVIDYREQVEQALIGERVDKASDAWLKEARERTRIEFRATAFASDPLPQEAGK
jgi:peptidyl-prolyl cis-trans isomerase SurA